MTLPRVISAELIKLRTLPVIAATVFATIGTAITLSAAIAASSTVAISGVQVTRATIPFVQIGVILLGVLAVATEYQGGQIRTTLTATPRRLSTLTGKSLAFLVTAVVTSGVAVGAGWVTATITLSVRHLAAAGEASLWPIVGVAVYLALIGSLAFALTVLLRSLIPPLVTMLSLVLIVSPLASGLTEHTRWLPDKAGSLLYLTDTDAVLDAGTGGLILLAWIIAISIAASTTFTRRDA
ncbi:ABC transporter integral membrane protein [Leucobacter sp. 7(1)]|jgi:ABC-2 type transport system permease protein|uniref:hypothetical protein n=1 Tax=Leucobacter sp. 7(1) TaxID=1255613 RepID=UPI00097F64B0|nr:hypothetical protein [Leucobacter sp. 7(1)]SJN12076.1 ABC transporter integral membrane protein [Leucobacter sp. 7(1)]